MPDRATHLIKTTARENEILDVLPELAEHGILPKEKTEVFRRGLHITKCLAQSNEEYLLRLLVEKLESMSLSKKNIEEIKSLANAVYSIFIAKRGIIGAEIFESVPIACSYLDLVEKQQIDEKEGIQMLEDISASIRTLILKESKVVGAINEGAYHAVMAKIISKSIGAAVVKSGPGFKLGNLDELVAV